MLALIFRFVRNCLIWAVAVNSIAWALGVPVTIPIMLLCGGAMVVSDLIDSWLPLEPKR